MRAAPVGSGRAVEDRGAHERVPELQAAVDHPDEPGILGGLERLGGQTESRAARPRSPLRRSSCSRRPPPAPSGSSRAAPRYAARMPARRVDPAGSGSLSDAVPASCSAESSPGSSSSASGLPCVASYSRSATSGASAVPSAPAEQVRSPPRAAARSGRATRSPAPRRAAPRRRALRRREQRGPPEAASSRRPARPATPDPATAHRRRGRRPDSPRRRRPAG